MTTNELSDVERNAAAGLTADDIDLDLDDVTSVDVTAWEPADEEYLGTKPKQWLRSPTGELWLWKESTIHDDARHGSFRKGDDWAEVVACRVGRRLGVPVATVELATRGERFGVVSRKVSDDRTETLVHGNELLAEIGVRASEPHDRAGYTVEAVARALASVGPPEPSTRLPIAFDWFVGYLVLDALVGNTDRHQDNWATIRGPAGQRLSPSFDHASCLGFQISNEERRERLAGVGTRPWPGRQPGPEGEEPGCDAVVRRATRRERVKLSRSGSASRARATACINHRMA